MHRSKARQPRLEFCGEAAYGSVEFPPGRIDRLSRRIHLLHLAADQTVQRIVFPHVLEKMFLRPPPEHSRRRPLAAHLLGGRTPRRLMSGGIQVPDFPDFKVIA